MKKTTDYVEDAWKSARQFADPGNEMNYVIGYLRGVIRMMEEANEHDRVSFHVEDTTRRPYDSTSR